VEKPYSCTPLIFAIKIFFINMMRGCIVVAGVN